ncbi:hypothetical protein AX15_006891 [Amanita polypyramis BW_CC]|nr:hypothetical protein AX15_006891 [Amanita polypyramis BW_CC]
MSGRQRRLTLTVIYSGLKATQYFSAQSSAAVVQFKKDLLELKFPSPKHDNVSFVSHGCMKAFWIAPPDSPLERALHSAVYREPSSSFRLYQQADLDRLGIRTFHLDTHSYDPKYDNPIPRHEQLVPSSRSTRAQHVWQARPGSQEHHQTQLLQTLRYTQAGTLTPYNLQTGSLNSPSPLPFLEALQESNEFLHSSNMLPGRTRSQTRAIQEQGSSTTTLPQGQEHAQLPAQQQVERHVLTAVTSTSGKRPAPQDVEMYDLSSSPNKRFKVGQSSLGITDQGASNSASVSVGPTDRGKATDPNFVPDAGQASTQTSVAPAPAAPPQSNTNQAQIKQIEDQLVILRRELKEKLLGELNLYERIQQIDPTHVPPQPRCLVTRYKGQSC